MMQALLMVQHSLLMVAILLTNIKIYGSEFGIAPKSDSFYLLKILHVQIGLDHSLKQ